MLKTTTIRLNRHQISELQWLIEPEIEKVEQMKKNMLTKGNEDGANFLSKRLEMLNDMANQLDQASERI